MNKKIDIHKRVFNRVYFKYLEDFSKMLLVLYGGAGSGKSFFVAQRYIYNILKGNRNILVIRKVQATIRDSVFSLLKKVINNWGLNDLFTINKTEYTFTCINGYKIICKGLDNPEKIKSVDVEKGVLTDIWIEESTELSEDDLKQLRLRLRGKSTVNKQIVMTFNPISQLHWIKLKIFDNIDNETEIVKTTYLDNDFLEQRDKDAIESLKDRDYAYYRIYGLGEWGVLGNLIFSNYKIEDLSEIRDKFNYYNNGLDFGFTEPAGLIRAAKKENNIYILDELYERELTNDRLAVKIKAMIGKEEVVCDSAEPKSIQELKQHGVNAVSAMKGKDSVMFGIKWLRRFNIIIDKRCQNFINEIQQYKFAEDRHGNVKEDQPLDMNNHCFIGETNIITNKGEKLLKYIKDGDIVKTQNGYNKVLYSRKTRKENVYKLILSNGYELIGTKDHKIYTSKGEKTINSLRYYDIIKTNISKELEACKNMLLLKIKNIDGMENIFLQLGAVKTEEKGFIRQFGSFIKGRYRKTFIYTIKTEIEEIMTSIILNLEHQKNICLSIIKLTGKTSRLGKEFEKIVITLDRLQKNGIHHRKELIGIDRTGKNVGKTRKNIKKYVRFVVKYMKRLSPRVQNIAIKIVRLKHYGKEDVYNLTIENEHNYYANGILVSNCMDSLRYAFERQMRDRGVKSRFSAESLGI